MKKKLYNRLSLTEREEISRGLSRGLSLRILANALRRSPSTLSREIYKNGKDRSVYRAAIAQQRTIKRAQKRRLGKRKLNSTTALRKIIFSKLNLFWSPEQIAAFLKRAYLNNALMNLSPETIYSYIYVLPKGELKKTLISQLRRSHKRRHRRAHNIKGEENIPHLVSIDERPQEVDGRAVPGHWEGDIILGKQSRSFLGTLVERMVRKVILVPLKSKKASLARRAFAREVKTIPDQFRHTLTYDRGTEMAEHKLFTKATKIKVYFAHLSSPWERGTNENTNGLLRQFFPKGTDFSKIPRRKIKKVERLLNERPRKTLGWKTPDEVYNEILLRKK